MNVRGSILIVIALFTWSTCSVASDVGSGDDGWKSALVIYLMGPNLDGTVGTGPVESDIKLDPSDVLDAFDSGFLGIFGMEKGRWGFVLDAVYMDLSQEATSPGGLFTGTVGTEQLIFGALASYRLNDTSRLLFGGLYVDLKNLLSLMGPLQDRRFEISEDWVDPFIGMDFSKPLNDKWTLGGIAGVGGFGVGSDFTWQVTGSLSYALTPRTRLSGGFRYMDFDYEDGSGADYFKFDMAEYGAAFGFRFDF